MSDVTLSVKLDSSEVESIAERLVELLKSANSLTNELAEKLKHLEVNVES